jgi:acyl carrier protein
MQTMADDLRDRSIEVIVRTLKVDPAVITDESRFVEDLGAESMQSVELMAAFEEEFDVDIDDTVAAGHKTVGQAIAYMRTLVE